MEDTGKTKPSKLTEQILYELTETKAASTRPTQVCTKPSVCVV